MAVTLLNLRTGPALLPRVVNVGHFVINSVSGEGLVRPEGFGTLKKIHLVGRTIIRTRNEKGLRVRKTFKV
jgi:hypothetical protein